MASGPTMKKAMEFAANKLQQVGKDRYEKAIEQAVEILAGYGQKPIGIVEESK